MEYSEPELIIPALEVLMAFPEGIDTAGVLVLLRDELQPSGHDLEILKDRNDDHFSQKVRNLRSHKTLEKKGLATFKNGNFRITENGRAYLQDNRKTFETLADQGFKLKDREAAAKKDWGEIVIEEGAIKRLSQKVFKRSKKLAEHARAEFSDAEGRIECAGCGFEGSTRYGEAGKGLIEIHHREPLYLSEGEPTKKELGEALKSVAPLCPNCHRLIHRDVRKMLSMDELKALVVAGQ